LLSIQLWNNYFSTFLCLLLSDHEWRGKKNERKKKKKPSSFIDDDDDGKMEKKKMF
jgi:hypothetical protein